MNPNQKVIYYYDPDTMYFTTYDVIGINDPLPPYSTGKPPLTDDKVGLYYAQWDGTNWQGISLSEYLKHEQQSNPATLDTVTATLATITATLAKMQENQAKTEAALTQQLAALSAKIDGGKQ